MAARWYLRISDTDIPDRVASETLCLQRLECGWPTIKHTYLTSRAAAPGLTRPTRTAGQAPRAEKTAPLSMGWRSTAGEDVRSAKRRAHSDPSMRA